MKQAITLAIADDHDLFRNGIISLLKNYEGIQIISEASNGIEVLESFKKAQPDVLLLDIDMPKMDGRETLKQLQKRHPATKVIMLSMHYEDAYILEFISNGASSFLPKNCSYEELIFAICSVKENGFYYNKKVTEAIVKEARKSTISKATFSKLKLTQREQQILKLLYYNNTNAEIADALDISVRTVEGHRANMLHKLDGQTLQSLMEWFIQSNFFSEI